MNKYLFYAHPHDLIVDHDDCDPRSIMIMRVKTFTTGRQNGQSGEKKRAADMSVRTEHEHSGQQC